MQTETVIVLCVSAIRGFRICDHYSRFETSGHFWSGWQTISTWPYVHNVQRPLLHRRTSEWSKDNGERVSLVYHRTAHLDDAYPTARFVYDVFIVLDFFLRIIYICALDWDLTFSRRRRFFIFDTAGLLYASVLCATLSIQWKYYTGHDEWYEESSNGKF